MRTDPSSASRGAKLSAAGVLAALLVFPVAASVSAAPVLPVSTATPAPGCTTPCAGLPAAQVTLAETVSRTSAVLGTTISYTVTVANPGSLPVALVNVDDVMGGDAAYTVEDGTLGTVNSFAGLPVVTVTRLVTGHYRWTYPAIAPGQTDVVRFSALMLAPRGTVPAGTRVVDLTSTASTPGASPVTVSTTAPLTTSSPPGGSGRTSVVPSTGAGLNVALAAVLVLGGLGLTLFGGNVRRRDGRAHRPHGPPPAPFR